MHEYRMTRNEKGAFQDRRNSLLRRQQAIDDAREKARQLDITQLQHPNASLFPLEFQTVKTEAANCDEAVIEATRECDKPQALQA